MRIHLSVFYAIAEDDLKSLALWLKSSLSINNLEVSAESRTEIKQCRAIVCAIAGIDDLPAEEHGHWYRTIQRTILHRIPDTTEIVFTRLRPVSANDEEPLAA